MRGRILAFDPTRGTGLVSGDDGRRYELAAADWRGTVWPASGDVVDFVAEGEAARAAFPLLSSGAEPMRWGHFLWSFAGRVPRRDYWLRFFLPALLAGLGAGVIDAAAGTRALAALVQIALIWPTIAVGAKRCHDRDRSGWFQLVGLIPVVGPIWLLVELGFLRGTRGPNRFGPDPLAGA
jgi:uncharacterized membrane protein YhaH (DUF805 family)